MLMLDSFSNSLLLVEIHIHFNPFHPLTILHSQYKQVCIRICTTVPVCCVRVHDLLCWLKTRRARLPASVRYPTDKPHYPYLSNHALYFVSVFHEHSKYNVNTLLHLSQFGDIIKDCT